MNIRATARMLGAALVAVGLVASATRAHADIKCRQQVNKGSAKLTQSIAKTLQKCEQGVLDGKLPGPCPDTESATKINDAKAKFVEKTADKCVGSTGEFPFGQCPNETGGTGSCGGILIQDKTDVGDCLACLAEHNAKELVQAVLYTGPLPSPAPSPFPGSGDPSKCQKAVGKETVKFFAAKSKALSECRDGVLKGKIPSCPDAETTAALATAESKKISAITKKCCGDDGVCGGATCAASAPVVICNGGSNDLGPCDTDSACPGGGVCVSTAAGDPCEAASDCGRCRNGTTGGEPCRGNGQCQNDPGACNPLTLLCVGGPNDGDACTLNCVGGANAGAVCSVASQCPGGLCGNCPSTASGTCQGTTGLCGGVDDLRPIQDLGFPSPCPGLTAGGSPIALTGQTGASLLTCVDTQASDRADCQDAAGAAFAVGGLLPPECVDAVAECLPDGGTATVTVSFATPGTCNGGKKAGKSCTTDGDCPGGTCDFLTLGGISISLGYTGVMIPGHGDITSNGTVTYIQAPFVNAENDNDDSLVVSPADPFTGFTQGDLFTVAFKTCGTTPTAANFGCVVRSASDTGGGDILDGVSCQVTL